MLVSSVQGAEIAQTTAKTAAETQKSAASPSSIQPYYFSPALVIDPKTGTDVLEYRNTSTGAVINQYPSEKDIKAYTQTGAATNAIAATVAKPAQSLTAADTNAAKPVTNTNAQSTQAVSQTTVVV